MEENQEAGDSNYTPDEQQGGWDNDADDNLDYNDRIDDYNSGRGYGRRNRQRSWWDKLKFWDYDDEDDDYYGGRSSRGRGGAGRGRAAERKQEKIEEKVEEIEEEIEELEEEKKEIKEEKKVRKILAL